jgi:methyl-accepting chemotaxis protein
VVHAEGNGEFSVLLREALAMGAAVEQRASAAAERQQTLEKQRRELLDEAREREAAEATREATARAEAEVGAARERERQAAQQREMREREEAARVEAAVRERLERESHRRDLAMEFETQVAGLVKLAGETVVELKSTADELARQADGSVHSSQEAGSVASEADSTAGDIAMSAEGLSHSAATVRRQAERSRSEALAAMAEADETRSLIEGLIGAVQQISTIADMIGEVSRKSEMLGINARIEAARAGEAGRGFAVVATDVKDLAAQTREATERIERLIAQVNDAARRSAEFLQRIGSRVTELGSSSSEILASAESQCQATTDIAQRMSSVSRSTRTAVSNIEAARGRAAATAELSATVLDSAHRMDEQTRRMQERIAEFVLAIQGVGRTARPAPAPVPVSVRQSRVA